MDRRKRAALTRLFRCGTLPDLADPRLRALGTAALLHHVLTHQVRAGDPLCPERYATQEALVRALEPCFRLGDDLASDDVREIGGAYAALLGATELRAPESTGAVVRDIVRCADTGVLAPPRRSSGAALWLAALAVLFLAYVLLTVPADQDQA